MIEPGWVTAGAACVTAGVAVVATFIARSQLKHVRTDSRERSRPMMAAELRRPPHVPGTQLLVVRNYGSSIARQVVVTFDSPIPDPSPEKAARSVSPFVRRRYAETISVITPGMELSNIWFSGVAGTGGRWENFEPTPERFTVTFTYQGPDGYSYEDAIQLDTGLSARKPDVLHVAGKPDPGRREIPRDDPRGAHPDRANPKFTAGLGPAADTGGRRRRRSNDATVAWRALSRHRPT